MPTIRRIGPYRVYFYSHDVHEPPHVHVDRERMGVKVWLVPVRVARNRGFTEVELARIERLVREHADQFMEAWYEFFGREG